jgi:hypothetical protein
MFSPPTLLQAFLCVGIQSAYWFKTLLGRPQHSPGSLGLGKQEGRCDAFSLADQSLRSVMFAVEVDTTSYYKPRHEARLFVIYGGGMFWFPMDAL